MKKSMIKRKNSLIEGEKNMEKRRKRMVQVIMILIYISLTISGLVLMKLGGNPGSISMTDGNINLGISPISLIGFICYIGSFFLFTRMVVMFDLSYIMPLTTGIVQVLSLICSKFIFKEEFTTTGIIGAAIIIIGVILLNWKSA